ncbi:hypothetical protein IQ269_09030 [Tychonema sp. LEGE 07199]|uniref:hypothetical protein n=1 Tax=unclassified Tychonema TaxID=2642144 RepID=UPI00187F27DA|nr:MULTISPECIES: hypothetical protein [unclassified Tychonema]MBE9120957.1 hypothetical protein [Tychonema sp. LEGE 07199]MBE9135345.1 hypothetical protein [Tychonema sp. LEGE 07196]
MSVAPHSPHSIAYPNNLQTKTNHSITAGPIALERQNPTGAIARQLLSSVIDRM